MKAPIKETLPQILEQQLSETVQERAIKLLAMGAEIRRQIGEKTDEKKGVEGFGMLGKLSEIEEELRLIQVQHELTGLRHNKLQFSSNIREGRESFNKNLFVQELVEAGIDVKLVMGAMKAATKKGDSYWVREWRETDG